MSRLSFYIGYLMLSVFYLVFCIVFYIMLSHDRKLAYKYRRDTRFYDCGYFTKNISMRSSIAVIASFIYSAMVFDIVALPWLVSKVIELVGGLHG